MSVKSLTVETYGTRGSQAVSNRESVETGGNTTSIRIQSPCLPPGMALVVDAGTGFPPMAKAIVGEGITGNGDGHEDDQLVMLFSHYHPDHTDGMLSAWTTYMHDLPVRLIGPVDNGPNGSVGPKEMMQHIFNPPFFPVAYKNVADHFSYNPLDLPSTYVILIHPKGGLKIMALDEYRRLVRKGGHRMPFAARTYYALNECLVIRMMRTDHPQMAISYRFDEMPTGKSFVLLTDCESMDGIPQDLRNHLQGADLLIVDVQYKKDDYYNRTAGWGHAWAGFAARLATLTGINRLGTTHHDPFSTDADVEAIVQEIRTQLAAEDPEVSREMFSGDNVFACKDYGMYEV